MGYNTSIIVINDALDQIAKDPAFGRNLADAITRLNNPYVSRDVAAGNHCNAANVIETHHADLTTLVTFGGNRGVKQIQTYGWNHHEPVMQLRMCQEWAKKFGYRLVKMPGKKVQPV